ncbi:hypothetical protein [Luteimonas huabeiensis]|uniref:hypothetical protein n=1 Tax=Luteimonas huabeiensis TaxID=1244513 RepID=UPI00126839BE|nr:hypothetical protein [Luteimonas huabeiensis]
MSAPLSAAEPTDADRPHGQPRPQAEAVEPASARALRALPPPPPAPPAPPVAFDAPVPLDAPATDAATQADEDLDESPPATADSPEVHRAWLQRIRELRDAGRLREARESLAEWRNRYPWLAVPDDLKPLADPP